MAIKGNLMHLLVRVAMGGVCMDLRRTAAVTCLVAAALLLQGPEHGSASQAVQGPATGADAQQRPGDETDVGDEAGDSTQYYFPLPDEVRRLLPPQGYPKGDEGSPGNPVDDRGDPLYSWRGTITYTATINTGEDYSLGNTNLGSSSHTTAERTGGRHEKIQVNRSQLFGKFSDYSARLFGDVKGTVKESNKSSFEATSKGVCGSQNGAIPTTVSVHNAENSKTSGTRTAKVEGSLSPNGAGGYIIQFSVGDTPTTTKGTRTSVKKGECDPSRNIDLSEDYTREGSTYISVPVRFELFQSALNGPKHLHGFNGKTTEVTDGTEDIEIECDLQYGYD